MLVKPITILKRKALPSQENETNVTRISSHLEKLCQLFFSVCEFMIKSLEG